MISKVSLGFHDEGWQLGTHEIPLMFLLFVSFGVFSSVWVCRIDNINLGHSLSTMASP